MRDRNAGVRGHRHRRAHARHDLERNARLRESLGLLAAAAEHERIAALEPHDTPPPARVLDEQVVDLALRQRVIAARLAGEDVTRAARHA